MPGDRSLVNASDEILRVMGRRWALPVLEVLDGGASRRATLAGRLDNVSPPVLTAALRALMDAGLVTRSQVSTRFVEYAITPLGRSVMGPARQLRDMRRSAAG
jgi:DNA-binding HxlR family transcriptional regulator